MKPTAKISLVILLFLYSFLLNAKEVELSKIQRVAINIFSENSGISPNSLKITKTISIHYDGQIVFYIFNFSPKGHIVISNDDVVEPVLGYGLSSTLDLENAPPGLLFLLNEYKKEISYIRKEKIGQHKIIKEKWEKYSSEDFLSTSLKSYTIGEYLINTMWGGGDTYNRFCPLKTNGIDHCPAGCGAVAVAQILHYWNNRVFPDGSVSYTNISPNVYLSVDFWDSEYNWDAMDLDDADDYNAELIYHCGVALNSEYTDSNTGSNISDILGAMVNNFGFKNSINSKTKNAYLSTWESLIRTEIDNERPIFYIGTDTSYTPDASHIWVVDGYRTSDNKYRCNWGWGDPNPNTWYTLTNLNPYPYNYNSYQSAIFNVEPIMDGNSGLTGANTICWPDTIPYSVSIPSYASIQWDCDNLTQIGGNTNTTYYIRVPSYTTSVAGSITATIKNSQGQTFLVKSKNVWAGIPSTPITYPTGDPAYQMQDGDILVIQVTSAPGASSSLYNWDVSGSISRISSNPSQNCHAETVSLGDGYFSVTSSNQCGTSPEYEGSVYVNQFLRLMVTPNPSSNETTVSIVSTSTENKFDETAGWELEVYDASQLLKEKKTNLKGKGTKINTQNWNEGIYIVRVKYKDEILQGKLVVKK
jgi:hypothetical protein